MTNSSGQFTLWASVYHLLKSEHICTSHKPRASFQRWLVGGDLVHEICPHAATQSYVQVLVGAASHGPEHEAQAARDLATLATWYSKTKQQLSDREVRLQMHLYLVYQIVCNL